MLTTFGQAKRALARYADAYQLSDIGAAVNAAVDELAASRNWQLMRKVRRFTATGEFFAIPQDCESVLRVAVDGTPVSMRGTDYEFLHSGPGDLDDIPAGYAPANGIQDLGYYATMYDFPAGASLVAFCTEAVPPAGALKVKGLDANGDIVSGTVPVQHWDSDIDDVTLTVTPLAGVAQIDRVILPDDVVGYVSMYALLDGVCTFVSRMHPSVRIPEFRRYRMAGFSSDTDASYRILAEVRLRAMPLVDDDDVLPFDSLLPVQYMMTSIWNMNSGEVKTADDYRQRALALLAAREDVSQERQGLVVLNTLFEGSLGEASENFFNI